MQTYPQITGAQLSRLRHEQAMHSYDLDARDVELARGGDGHAFQQLVARYFDTVFAVAQGCLRERETAEEAAQEVFLRAHLALHQLECPRYFAAWIHTIARNIALDWARRGQRQSRLMPMVSLDDAEVSEIEDSHGWLPDEQLMARQDSEKIQRAVMELPSSLREVVLMHFTDDLSPSEIARRTGVDRSTVGRQLKKALKELRRSLTREEALSATATAFARAPIASRTRAIAFALALATAPEALRAALVAEAGNSPVESAIGSFSQHLASEPAWTKWAAPGALKSVGILAITLLIGVGVLTAFTRRGISGFFAQSRTSRATRIIGQAAASPSAGGGSGRTVRHGSARRPKHRGATGASTADFRSSALGKRMVEGWVVGTGGEPVAGADVVVRGSPLMVRYDYFDTTDEAGWFHVELHGEHVEGETANLLVRPGKDYAKQIVYGVPVNSAPQTIRLKSGATIAGRVLAEVSSATVPLADVPVFAMSSDYDWSNLGVGALVADSEGRPCYEWPDKPVDRAFPEWTLTDLQGRFQFDHLCAEQYSDYQSSDRPRFSKPFPRGWTVRCQDSSTGVVAEEGTTTNVQVLVREARAWTAGEWCVSGAVTDAETSCPVKAFRVTVRDSDHLHWGWGGSRGIRREAGRYCASSPAHRGLQVRIEADGYAPFTTPLLYGRGTSVTLDVALEPSVALYGMVSAESRTPVVGAQVVLYAREKEALIVNGRPESFAGDDISTVTNARGRFSLPLQSDDTYRIMVFSDAGTSEVRGAEFAVSPEIVMVPWGRVSGTLSRDGQPASGELIRMWSPEYRRGSSSYDSSLSWHYHVRTDAEGRFEFDRVFPARSIMVSSEKGSTSTLSVRAGQTTRVVWEEGK